MKMIINKATDHLVCRQRRRKLGCERWSVIHKHIHKHVATGKSALVARESPPAESAVVYFAGLTVYSSNHRAG